MDWLTVTEEAEATHPLRAAIAGAAFAGLESLTTTRDAIVPRSGASRQLPASLFGLSGLRRLHLKGFDLRDAAVGLSFARLRALEDLTLVDFEAPSDLAALATLPLRRLSLENARSLLSLQGVPSGALESLFLHKLPALEPSSLESFHALRELTLSQGVPWRRVPPLPRGLRRLSIGEPPLARWARIESLEGVLTATPELEALTIGVHETPLSAIPDLERLPALHELAVYGALALPGACPALETLTFEGDPPAWVGDCPRLRAVSVAGGSERETTLRRLLALPALESLSVTMYGAPVTVPDAFGEARRLRRVRLHGEWSDPARTIQCVAGAPALEDLELFHFAIPDLPAAIEQRPLRRFAHYPPTKGVRLDLAAAFRRLARTPLRVLELWDVTELPDEIGLLESLESLSIKSHPFPKLPDSIAKLARLRRIDYRPERLPGPLRKSLAKLLPACAVFDSIG